MWVLGDHRTEATKHLSDRLKKFAFAGVTLKDFSKDGCEFFIYTGQLKAPGEVLPTSDKLNNDEEDNVTSARLPA